MSTNKFESTLSASNAEIKSARAKALSNSTILEVESFIQNLRKEKNQLVNKLNSLTDLAPDNSYSLRPGSKEFDAAEWMKELHTTKMDLELKDIELKAAQDIFDEWFAPSETEAKA